MPDPGYCTVDDVRRVMREASFSGALDADPQIVENAIRAQTETTTAFLDGRHFYEPDTTDGILASEPFVATDRRFSIPSTPYADNQQLFGGTSRRYPKQTDGPYTRIALDHYNVTDVTALRVRDAGGGFEDWTTAASITEGRGEDWYLSTPTDGGPASRSRVLFRASSLPPAANYSGMIVADYEYGRPQIPDSVRRASAFLAAAELAVDDEADISFPDDGQLVNKQSQADFYKERAQTLLEPYMGAPVA